MRSAIICLLSLSLLPTLEVHARQIVTKDDFAFVGAFMAPVGWLNSLTHRYRGGQIYLYSIVGSGSNKGHVYEFPIPTLGQTRPYPTQSAFRNYGDIFQDKLRTTVSDGATAWTDEAPGVGVDNSTIPRIYWDEIDQRMYWTKLIGYNNTIDRADVSTGYSTLDDSTPSGTGVGSWKLDTWMNGGSRNHRWMGGFLPIPPSFAATYTGGKRIGIGFGGPVSIISNGVASIGPTLFAMPPLNPTTTLYTHTDVPLLELLSSIGTAAPRGSEHLCFNNYLDPFKYSSDHWIIGDTVGGAVWIDGVNKHGVVYVTNMAGGNLNTTITNTTPPTLTSFSLADIGDAVVGDKIQVHTDNYTGQYPFETCSISGISGNTVTVTSCANGNPVAAPGGGNVTSTLKGVPIVGQPAVQGVYYAGGGPTMSRWYSSMYIYDPVDLANAALDPIGHPPTSILPVSNSNIAYPNITNPQPGTATGANQDTLSNARGVTFDPTTNRLYIMTFDPANYGSNVILVYQLNDSISTVNGSCGTSNGLSLSTAPTVGLCSAGTPSAVTGSGPWSWSCAGSGGGSTASCSASLAASVPAGDASTVVACPVIAGFR